MSKEFNRIPAGNQPKGRPDKPQAATTPADAEPNEAHTTVSESEREQTPNKAVKAGPGHRGDQRDRSKEHTGNDAR